MKPLTGIMKGMLLHMLTSNGTTYAYDTDRTLRALRDRGLVEYRRSGRYGKDHWGLTDEGTDVAKYLNARKRGLPHAVILTPTEYERVRREGHNMINYVMQRPMPPTVEVMPPGRWSGRKLRSERACPDDNCMPGLNGKCTACAEEN